MKKLILTLLVITGATFSGYSQGVINFDNTPTGYGSVVVNNSGVFSYSGSFTVALFAAVPTAVTLAQGPDAYGQLTYSQFLADSFTLAATTTGGGQYGTFSGGTATLGVAGGYSAGNYTVNDYVALAAWTGGYANLAAAVTANAAYGIITFVNPVGPGGASPNIPNLSGWLGVTPTPADATFEGSGYPNDLIMTVHAVPEPSTMALAALGGVSLLLFRRRK